MNSSSCANEANENSLIYGVINRRVLLSTNLPQAGASVLNESESFHSSHRQTNATPTAPFRGSLQVSNGRLPTETLHSILSDFPWGNANSSSSQLPHFRYSSRQHQVTLTTGRRHQGVLLIDLLDEALRIANDLPFNNTMAELDADDDPDLVGRNAVPMDEHDDTWTPLLFNHPSRQRGHPARQ